MNVIKKPNLESDDVLDPGYSYDYLLFGNPDDDPWYRKRRGGNEWAVLPSRTPPSQENGFDEEE